MKQRLKLPNVELSVAWKWSLCGIRASVSRGLWHCSASVWVSGRFSYRPLMGGRYTRLWYPLKTVTGWESLSCGWRRLTCGQQQLVQFPISLSVRVVCRMKTSYRGWVKVKRWPISDACSSSTCQVPICCFSRWQTCFFVSFDGRKNSTADVKYCYFCLRIDLPTHRLHWQLRSCRPNPIR